MTIPVAFRGVVALVVLVIGVVVGLWIRFAREVDKEEARR